MAKNSLWEGTIYSYCGEYVVQKAFLKQQMYGYIIKTFTEHSENARKKFYICYNKSLR